MDVNVKLPFCQGLYDVKCDCGIIRLSNYSNKTMPPSFGGLKSLIVIDISGGQS